MRRGWRFGRKMGRIYTGAQYRAAAWAEIKAEDGVDDRVKAWVELRAKIRAEKGMEDGGRMKRKLKWMRRIFGQKLKRKKGVTIWAEDVLEVWAENRAEILTEEGAEA